MKENTVKTRRPSCLKKTAAILLPLLTVCQTVHALDVSPPDETFIYKYDQNGDGRLSLKEFLAIEIKNNAPPGIRFSFPISRGSFRTLDRNRNGYLETKDNLPIDFDEKFKEEIDCWPRKPPCK